MFMEKNWHLMLHGVAFANDIRATGFRGREKRFATNWVMASGQHSIDRRTSTIRCADATAGTIRRTAAQHAVERPITRRSTPCNGSGIAYGRFCLGCMLHARNDS